MNIGLVAAVDSWLCKDKRLSERDVQRLLKHAQERLVQKGFGVHSVSVMDLLQGNLTDAYIQLSVTEEIEESRQGNTKVYSLPVTTVLVWIDDPKLPHRHREKAVLVSYHPFSIKNVCGILSDVLDLVCARLRA